MKFQKHHLQHIKDIVSEQTGITMQSAHRRHFVVRKAAVAAAAIGLLAMTAVAAELFSSLSGDQVTFASTYEGNGIVTIEVENRSSKQLMFQKTLKLMQFYGNREIEPHGQVLFSGTTIEPESSGTLQVDLSAAYDLDLLEQELPGDWYYLILTNSNFAFGQDWMCTVEFAPAVFEEARVQTPVANKSDPAMEKMSFDTLQPYFERARNEMIFGQPDRFAFAAAYYEEAESILSQVDGRIIPATDPLETGIQIQEDFLRLDPEKGYFVPQDGYLMSVCNVSAVDGFFVPVGRENERAMVAKALLPQDQGDSNDGGTAIPLAYFMAYNAESIQGQHTYAFIRGQLIPFSEMTDYEVYRDESYVIYNVTALFYTNLDAYMDSIRSRVGPTYLDDAVMSCLRNHAAYYQKLSQDHFTRSAL